jgi:hypothetical protein
MAGLCNMKANRLLIAYFHRLRKRCIICQFLSNVGQTWEDMHNIYHVLNCYLLTEQMRERFHVTHSATNLTEYQLCQKLLYIEGACKVTEEGCDKSVMKKLTKHAFTFEIQISSQPVTFTNLRIITPNRLVTYTYNSRNHGWYWDDFYTATTILH